MGHQPSVRSQLENDSLMALQDSGSSRVKVTGLDFNQIRDLINLKPEQIAGDVEELLREVGADAVRDMRTTIQSAAAATATGRANGRPTGRVRNRGEASLRYRPRIAGRSMLDSVDYEIRRNKNSTTLRFGWITGRPGYAFFQEYGTNNGVQGMHALTDAKAHADVKIKRALGKL